MNVRAAALGAFLLALATPAAAQTVAEVQTRATAGDRQSQFLLGEAYRTGQGVTPDRDQAIAWFRKAAAQGDTRASDALGLLLFTRGDRRESIALLEAAETREDARAYYLLGAARFNGDGVAKDLPRAYAEMRAAADSGLPQAVRSLQLMEPYINAQDRQAAQAIRPGRTPPVIATPAARRVSPPPLAVPPPVSVAPAPAPIAVGSARVAGRPASCDNFGAATPNAPGTLCVTELPPSTPPKPFVAPPPKPKPIPATGKYRVQLGAIATRDKAEEHWRMLIRKLPRLSSLSHTSVQAGAIWRLQATGLASTSDAQALCRQVIAKGGDCIALSPAP